MVNTNPRRAKPRNGQFRVSAALQISAACTTTTEVQSSGAEKCRAVTCGGIVRTPTFRVTTGLEYWISAVHSEARPCVTKVFVQLDDTTEQCRFWSLVEA